jgi:hypothetical protein
MLQITPQMKILVAVEPADFRKGIDRLVRLCKDSLQQDPFADTVFVFRNRRGTAIKVLVYDGQGFWLCHKRLSEGRFRWWPSVPAKMLRTKPPRRKPWRLINCRYCSQPAIRIEPPQHRTGAESAQGTRNDFGKLFGTRSPQLRRTLRSLSR